MPDAPLVSVVIPTFNRRDAVLRAVGSVLGQSHDDLEVIVVDDHSTDDTIEALSLRPDPRLRVLQTDAPSGGPARPRNTGVAAARGVYVAFLDSDDEYLPGFLRTALAQLSAGHLLFCANAEVVAATGDVVGPAFTDMPAEADTADLLRTNWVITSSVVADLATLRLALPFPESSAHALYEDFTVWLAASLVAPWRISPVPLVKYCGPATEVVSNAHYSSRYPHHSTAMVNTIAAVTRTAAYLNNGTIGQKSLLSGYKWRWRAHALARRVLPRGT